MCMDVLYLRSNQLVSPRKILVKGKQITLSLSNCRKKHKLNGSNIFGHLSIDERKTILFHNTSRLSGTARNSCNASI